MTSHARPSLMHRRPVMWTVALLACAWTGQAVAQWHVIDRDLIRESQQQWKEENELREKANERLDNLQTLGKHETAGEEADEPAVKLDANNPGGTVSISQDKRCPAPAGKGAVLKQQHQLCQEIVKTELARYTYALKMHELTRTRYERFEAIQEEREGLKEEQQGRLQDNSNKLLALMSLMEIDRQQYRTYMDAYEARLAYLSAARDRLTRDALHGKKDGGGLGTGGIVGGIVGGAALKAALELAKTRQRHEF
ncbi:hypothetical protein [Novilysobacter selenitireducens]|uniref:Uncharacterized protein n=1 Tax=Novilysobacter selenitireducens TaxID=2872639 RepID=A0ABS7T6T7_9GAMM|nr:hypothetical protein [Lysobacter selenitireducens]MBZ4039590.1 hypothetical protein [Lysobacter selenitireducens]